MNQKKSDLKTNELNQWKIETETTVESAGIAKLFGTQTYSGIKIDNSYIYFWIKNNNEIINSLEGFIF